MSIQGLADTSAYTESRRAAARQTAPSRASFQAQLEKTAAGAAPKGISLPDTLNDARLLLLRRTKEGREWKKEQEEWDRLMKCLDNWIEVLREKGDREREGRSGGDITAGGGEALMALYRSCFAGAVWTEAADDPALAREDLLSTLTAARSDLLERLKEDKADEEDREAWADLLKRLDRWIESLRAEDGDQRAGAVGARADAAGI